jgi:hypothetical protein
MSYNLAYEKLPCYISRIALNMSTAWEAKMLQHAMWLH